MGTEIEISRRRELLGQAHARLERVMNGPKATDADAAKAVRLLIGAYTNTKIPDPDVYMRMVRHLLVGQPMDVLTRFADPRNGIFTDHPTFPPGVGAVALWLENATARHRAEEARCTNEIETLSIAPEPEVNAEERARRLETSAQVSKEMRPQGQPVKELEWMKPEREQSPAQRAETERARKCQAPDTPEQRAQLLKTSLMKSPRIDAA